MGASCTGEQNESEEERKNMEDVEADDIDEKFTKVINDYQAENEQLKSELNNLKELNDAKLAEHEEKTRQNEEVMRELGEIKALVETKDSALVRGRLEAALLSKANSMLSVESKLALYKKGWLLHHYKRKSKKMKYVEVHVSVGEVEAKNFKAGYVTMTYSDKMDGKISNRCQVVEVILDQSTGKDLAFTVKVMVEGVIRDMLFACETADQRDEWVKAINDGLAEVQSTYDDMHSLFTLKLEFSKEKLGFMVEESFIDYDDGDSKLEVSEQVNDGNAKKNMKEGAKISNGEEATETGEKVGKDLKVVVDTKVEGKSGSNDDDEGESKEEPCELLVNMITDDALIAAGLQVNCVLREINGTVLSGMVYSKQLSLLRSTPKPYVLTFTGNKYLKRKPEAKCGYFSIFKELVTDGDNSVKSAFNDLIAGTQFQKELDSSTDKKATIQELLSNQGRLIALLRDFTVHEMAL